MNDKMNKNAICSVVALEIIDYSKKTNAEQVEIKSLLNGFIQHALIDIPQDDRLIVETVSGVAIACSGPLEDALEDALFISITIRDEILKNNTHGSIPLYVQFGINLGAARMVKNSMVGEGIDEARRIMSFANPNQILVSHVYFEMASKLTQEIAQMFEKYEMHAHEHDVYAVRLLKETVPVEPSAVADGAEVGQSITNKINWSYVALVFLALLAFFALAKLAAPPIEPALTMEQPVVAEPPAASELTVESSDNSAKKAKDTPKKAKQKAAEETENVTSNNEKTRDNSGTKPAESKIEKSDSNDKSGWQSFKESVKQGSERACTQAEIAMNQCAK
jgi:F0F1-type ATP synthase membrane subunit b/b'